jgi:hypothetical protein
MVTSGLRAAQQLIIIRFNSARRRARLFSVVGDRRTIFARMTM